MRNLNQNQQVVEYLIENLGSAMVANQVLLGQILRETACEQPWLFTTHARGLRLHAEARESATIK